MQEHYSYRTAHRYMREAEKIAKNILASPPSHSPASLTDQSFIGSRSSPHPSFHFQFECPEEFEIAPFSEYFGCQKMLCLHMHDLSIDKIYSNRNINLIKKNSSKVQHKYMFLYFTRKKVFLNLWMV